MLVRIPDLPIKYYDLETLWEIGDIIGKTLCIDSNTLREATMFVDKTLMDRAQLARIYVEVAFG